MTNNMGHPFRHAISRLQRPLKVQDYYYHWWLVQPSTWRANTEAIRYDSDDFDAVLKRLRERYANADSRQQRMIHDHDISAPDDRCPWPYAGKDARVPNRIYPQQFISLWAWREWIESCATLMMWSLWKRWVQRKDISSISTRGKQLLQHLQLCE